MNRLLSTLVIGTTLIYTMAMTVFVVVILFI